MNKKSNCGCNGHRLDKYVDVSCINPKPWNDVPVMLGLTHCGDVVPVDKPEYELSETDREKLDMLITDGQGNLFLGDDGQYHTTDTPQYRVLELEEQPANFIIKNHKNLVAILEDLRSGLEVFVRLHVGEFYIPVNVVIGESSMIIETDRPIVIIDGDDVIYRHRKVLIALDVTEDIYQVVFYQVKETVDANEVVVTSGDGTKALFDNGQYIPVYTMEQVDTFVAELRASVDANEADITALDERMTTAEGDIATLRTDTDANTEKINEMEPRLAEAESNIESLTDRVSTNEADIAGTKSRVTQAEADIQANAAAISALETSTEAGFEAVNSALGVLDGRVSQNETDIAVNKEDISQIRQDIADTEHFRGYFATTAEITGLNRPVLGDYAYNAETGTKWVYNGTTWHDTTVPVPDQTVEAYDSLPLMDGDANAGSSNKYARGDHRHPSDITKADKTDLNDYVPLAGNSQTSPISGDLWVGAGKKVRVTNSGTSYLGQDTDTNTTELVGAGSGGVDIKATNGTVKANGKEVVSFEENGDILAKNNIILENDRKILGKGADGTQHNLIEKSRFGIIDAGSTKVPFNVSSSVRPTVRVGEETGAQAENMAFLSDISDVQSDLQDKISANALAITENATDIASNKSDIDSILVELANTNHFRGYFATTAEITSLENPSLGDFAYNAATGTKWIYNGTTWHDSGDIIPDQTVAKYSGLPLMDGEAAAGDVNEYASGTHRHPTDTTRASVVDLARVEGTLAGVSDALDTYKGSNDASVSALADSVATNTEDLATLTGRVNTAEDEIDDLETRSTDTAARVDDLEDDLADTTGRVAVNESDIEAIRTEITNTEHFRGYFATTAEITGLDNPKPGDYAYNAETGTKWLYNGTTWHESGVPVPDQTVERYAGLPLMDGAASSGDVNQYASGTHRHPTDTSRASVTELVRVEADLTGVADELETYKDSNDTRVAGVAANVATNAGNITTLTGKMSEAETKIGTLEVQAVDTGSRVSDLETGLAETDGRVTVNEADIASIRSEITNTEHFRGYFATTVEITQLPATPGDFAWNGETNTVWVYDTSGPSWHDSQRPIPSTSIIASDTLPLIDGEAVAGTSTQYARGDHRHPTDITRASASDLATSNSRIATLEIDNETNKTQITALKTDTENLKGRVQSIEEGGGGVASDATPQMDGIAAAGTASEYSRGDHRHPVDTSRASAEDVTNLAGRVTGAEGKVSALETAVGQNTADITAVTGRVSQNESDIESLRDSITSTEHFRGYYSTTAEVIAISDPKSGDFAYNAQTGTKWAFNGTVWEDTTVVVPDQTVEASDTLPLMDGAANAGTSNRYSRGDHRHPTDTSRASVTSLEALAGRVTVLEDNGTGGVAPSDTYPLADGEAAAGTSALYSRGDHQHPSDPSKADITDLAGKADTTALAATNSTLSQLSSDFESNKTTVSAAITSLEGSVATNAGDITSLASRVSANESDIDELTDQVEANTTSIGANASEITQVKVRVSTNESDIAALQSQVTNSEHFKGYFATNAELQATAATPNDFAYSAESGTKWVYNGTAWVDTGVAVPDQMVEGSDTLPLMDGTASAGTSNKYARGDHRHPSDSTKANVTDIPTAVSQLTNDSAYITAAALAGYVPLATYNALVSRVAALEAILSGVSGFWTGTEAEYEAITTKDANKDYRTYEE